MNDGVKHRPPKWADNFLEWYCSPRFIEEIQGDLHEAFHRRARERGVGWAKFLFIADVLRSLSLRKIENPFHSTVKFSPMFRNYLTISLRNSLRSKIFSLINIVGLAIGMAACFLIVQYVRFELSYDRFHEKGDRIYRVILENSEKGTATNNPGVGPALKNDFPEVEEYARAVHQSIFARGVTAWSHVDDNGSEKVFNEERVYDVDPSFLTIFSFPFIHGDPKTAFPDRSSVVISESIAKKFFGSENPTGKTLVRDGYRSFTVTGVFKDIPENSHIKFDILVSYFMTDGWGDGWDHSWDWKWSEYFTYILVTPEANRESIEARLPVFRKKYLTENNKLTNKVHTLLLQPLPDIHLKSPNLTKEQEVHGSEKTVFVLASIAVLILLIAWINYVNLTTSKSAERAREVGIRKVAGATRKQLVIQFLFDSAMVNLVAIGISFVLVIVTLPYFNQLTGKNIGTTLMELSLINKPKFWLILIGLFLSGSFFAGLYPAFVLSSFRIVNVIKGKLFGSKSGIALRKALVGSQFAISAALIAGTLIVYLQVSFMRNQDLGYVKDQLLVVKSPSVLDSTAFTRAEAFKTELKRNPGINSIATTSEIPGKLIPQLNGIQKINDGVEGRHLVYHFYMDEEFISTYGIKLVAGRNFNDRDNSGNREERPMPLMVNEKVIQSLGFKSAEEAINQLVSFGRGPRDWTGEIVGVVENHHQRSLRGGYDPILFFPGPGLVGQYITINMNMRNPGELISLIKDQYEMNFPGNEFEYFFLDDYFDRQYASDEQFSKVFGLFSGLALFVAVLGLFGLSTFMISQRTKEIAIRKALGATISGLVALFSRDFIRLIIMANLIALPIVYFLVERWLSNFAFRINIGWVMFVVPAIILFVISLVTVSVQTVRTGSINPVKALRSE